MKLDKSDTCFVLNLIFMVLALICIVTSISGIAPLMFLGWCFIAIQAGCAILQIFFGLIE